MISVMADAAKNLNQFCSVRDMLPRTVDGFIFNPAADLWSIPTAGSPVSLNFSNLTGASETLREGIKVACASMLLSIAPERVMKALSSYRVLIRFVSMSSPCHIVNEICMADLHRFGASLSKRQQYLLRHLKEYLMLWVSSGAPGVASDLQYKLPKLLTENHEIGSAVRTMDPEEGPLTDVEYESVIAAIRQGFAGGKICFSDYVLLVLAIVLGARPLQLAMLKVRDLTITPREDGTRIFILQVTRLKQGKGIRPRTMFRSRELSTEVGELVRQQCATALCWAEKIGIDSNEAPIFPASSTSVYTEKLGELGLEGHLSGKGLSEKLSRLYKRISVHSHRTGMKLKLFQTRFRRTFGTRAAAEGLSAAVIADLMDHTWIDSSLVYVETRPAMIERIDKALALQIAPMAQAFAGTLVSSVSEQTSRVIHFSVEKSLNAVGGCGKHDFCGLAAPLACYTCTFFCPWKDGPHEFLLERLLVEREEILKLSDLRIASINDRTILAVADVVLRCREYSAKGVK